MTGWVNLLRTDASLWLVLIRLSVGLFVFLPEGIQKLAFADILGAGRFTKIGIPAPEVMGPFVDLVEIVYGPHIIMGLVTRPTTIPLIVTMITALLSTKVPILLGGGFWLFNLAQDVTRTGFWSMMHEARTDFAMLLSLLYLLIVGGGQGCLDATPSDRKRRAR